MQTWILLRTAAIITLIYCVGHAVGLPWTPATGPHEVTVINAMKSNQFIAMGNTRTYWDFYYGFGVIIIGYLAVQSVVLWQLAELARVNPSQVRPIIAAFFVAFAVNAVLAWTYFFALPAILAGAIAVCLAFAFSRVKMDKPV